MARPKKENHPISIRMNKEIYDRLTAFCEASGQPKTVAIERAVAEYIGEYCEAAEHKPIVREMRDERTLYAAHRENSL